MYYTVFPKETDGRKKATNKEKNKQERETKMTKHFECLRRRPDYVLSPLSCRSEFRNIRYRAERDAMSRDAALQCRKKKRSEQNETKRNKI